MMGHGRVSSINQERLATYDDIQCFRRSAKRKEPIASLVQRYSDNICFYTLAIFLFHLGERFSRSSTNIQDFGFLLIHAAPLVAGQLTAKAVSSHI